LFIILSNILINTEERFRRDVLFKLLSQIFLWKLWKRFLLIWFVVIRSYVALINFSKLFKFTKLKSEFVEFYYKFKWNNLIFITILNIWTVYQSEISFWSFLMIARLIDKASHEKQWIHCFLIHYKTYFNQTNNINEIIVILILWPECIFSYN